MQLQTYVKPFKKHALGYLGIRIIAHEERVRVCALYMHIDYHAPFFLNTYRYDQRPTTSTTHALRFGFAP